MIPPKPRVSSSYLFALLAFILFVTILYCNDFNFLFTRPSSSSHLQQQQQQQQQQPLLQPIPRPVEKSNSNPPPPSSHLEQQQQEPEPVVQPIPRTENINFNQPEQEPAIQPSHRTEKKVPFAVGEGGGCDVFNGKWMKDESNRPIYEESECPYIQPQLTCQEHGRPEKEYQFWRWQPHDCSLASFNATFMLEKLRGKRMLFVGDSLNRGQYVSMICLLHRVIPEHAKSMETFDSLTVFRAKEHNATIEFYWAPFLLESNSDDAVIHRVTDRIVRKGSINKHGRYWLGADILVFNTYLWWITGMKMKILRGSFADDKKRNNIMEMETDDAYRMAMNSMVKWVEKNVDQKTTRVFFTSMSPSHGKSIEWGGDPDGNCYNQTTPIGDPTYWGDGSRKSIMKVIGEVFSKSQVPITFLNITQLSEYRKDAHTSIYKKQWNPLTPKQLAHPASYADCTHWCLPGLQDTWNELLYTRLFYP